MQAAAGAVVPMNRPAKKPAAPPPPPDWQTDGRLMEHHVDTYRHRRAVERAARKHGARLGDSYRMLLAIRLRLVDVDRDGAAPPLMACVRLVARWSAEGRAPR